MIDLRELLRTFDDATLAVHTGGLVKRYGRKTALAGLDLRVPEGAVYVLVGPNGAGKTTTLRLLLGLVQPGGGEIRVCGFDPRIRSAEIRAAVGYVPESRWTQYGWMTVERLLAHQAAYRPSWDPSHADRLVKELELRPGARYGELSKGEARRVQLVAALSHRPALLLLDEPTDGLDPVMRDRFLALLADHLAASQTTVLFSTHLVQEAELLASHLGVLRGGRLHAQVDSETLAARLRRYRAEVPEGFAGIPDLEPAILDRREAGGEIDWVVWGEEARVVEALAGAGARPRHVRPLRLSEAARALIRFEEAAS